MPSTRKLPTRVTNQVERQRTPAPIEPALHPSHRHEPPGWFAAWMVPQPKDGPSFGDDMHLPLLRLRHLAEAGLLAGLLLGEASSSLAQQVASPAPGTSRARVAQASPEPVAYLKPVPAGDAKPGPSISGAAGGVLPG